MTGFLFANRTQWVLAQNELTRLLERFKKSGRPVIDLTESNPTRCGFKYPESRILKAFNNSANLAYEPSCQGLCNAREAVCRYYKRQGLDVDPVQVFLTSSTSEAYSAVFRLLLNPGEEIFVPSPSYPLFEFLAGLNDVKMNSYPLVYEGAWRIDLKRLEESLNARTKAVILVNPNNPTGSFIKPAEASALNRMCKERNIALICDEVFTDYTFSENGKEKADTVNNKDVLTFTLNGISKSLGLPQMKIGWIVLSGPAALVKEAGERLEVILDTYLSVNTPSQNALPAWLSLQPVMQEEILSRLKINRQYLFQQTKESLHPMKTLHCEGGWYAILRLPSICSEESWVMNLLEKDHVFVHPGYFFDFEGEPYIVVSLLPKPKIFAEGIKRIVARAHSGVS